MSILILNSRVVSASPPAEAVLYDGFESGAIDPGWDAAWGPHEIDTYGNFGVPAPPSGQDYLYKLKSTVGLAANLPSSYTEMWIECLLYFNARTGWNNALLLSKGTTDEVCRVQITTAGKLSMNCVAYSPDNQMGLIDHPEDTWLWFKIYVKIHETEGALQGWWHDGSDWVVDIDLQNIDTYRDVADVINYVQGPKYSNDEFFCDRIGYYTQNPSLEIGRQPR